MHVRRTPVMALEEKAFGIDANLSQAGMPSAYGLI